MFTENISFQDKLLNLKMEINNSNLQNKIDKHETTNKELENKLSQLESHAKTLLQDIKQKEYEISQQQQQLEQQRLLQQQQLEQEKLKQQQQQQSPQKQQQQPKPKLTELKLLRKEDAHEHGITCICALSTGSFATSSRDCSIKIFTFNPMPITKLSIYIKKGNKKI